MNVKIEYLGRNMKFGYLGFSFGSFMANNQKQNVNNQKENECQNRILGSKYDIWLSQFCIWGLYGE